MQRWQRIVRGDWRDSIAPSLALFGSASTLLCCALPALLTSIGAGAVMAGLTAAIPGTRLSAHKDILFKALGRAHGRQHPVMAGSSAMRPVL